MVVVAIVVVVVVAAAAAAAAVVIVAVVFLSALPRLLSYQYHSSEFCLDVDAKQSLSGSTDEALVAPGVAQHEGCAGRLQSQEGFPKLLGCCPKELIKPETIAFTICIYIYMYPY